MGGGEGEVMAQEIAEQQAGLDGAPEGNAVDGDVDRLFDDGHSDSFPCLSLQRPQWAERSLRSGGPRDHRRAAAVKARRVKARTQSRRYAASAGLSPRGLPASPPPAATSWNAAPSAVRPSSAASAG